MKRAYARELLELTDTYDSVRTTDSLQSLAVDASAPSVFVGSGGAFPVARLGADLHQATTGQPGLALSPLEFLGTALRPDVNVVMITARGRNRDVSNVLTAARHRDHRRIQAVTCAPIDGLPSALADASLDIVSVPSPQDGFLATNSVIAMGVALARSYGYVLPAHLDGLVGRQRSPLRSVVVALTGPNHLAPALDLETRLSETGVASVQVADFRNFAHGRHVGLERNLDNASVVAFVAQEYSDLADRTLHFLPEDADIHDIRSNADFPISALDLVGTSMHLAGTTCEALGVDPGRPGVPEWGRRLYSLRGVEAPSPPPPTPASRKVDSAQARSGLLEHFQASYARWLDKIRHAQIGAIALDYDGTCCTTDGRFDPPPSAVQTELLRLLDGGISVGFASGRGRSLHDGLRSWLPERLWSSVLVGMYNASVLHSLSSDVADYSLCDDDLAEAATRVESLDLGLQVTRRSTQVTIENSGSLISAVGLYNLVAAVVAQQPKIRCRTVASGHSVDITYDSGTKAAVVERLSELPGVQGVLAVGDQGGVNGNDFDLLAATPYSLSVDSCSADPTRCWNLSPGGLDGPTLLAKYLGSLKVDHGVATFDWRDP